MNYFRSVYTREPDGEPPTLQPRGANIQEDPGANFTLDDVRKKLRKTIEIG